MLWQRDPGVGKMVQWFDRIPEQYKDWDQMSPSDRFKVLKADEKRAVAEQFRMCVGDFSYAARNFFWITDKAGQDRLFTLWESQYLILQKYYELKAQGKPQKIMILKARQLGCSLLIEAMIAWRTMFFPNTEALVVSVDADHAQYLFGLMQHIYDMMPWWLKPEAASREYKSGLHFDRKNPEDRQRKPGLNSKVYVQHANQMSGVGQGRRISAAHCSEYTDWQQDRAEEIIEGDLLHAIADNPESFGFLESTGRGAGKYSHQLWKSCEKMAERAEWYPLFLPWFFESSRRVTTYPSNWKPDRAEAALAKRVEKEWVSCGSCSAYYPGALHGESRAGTVCPNCNEGRLNPVILDNAQLYWKEGKRENAEAKGKDSLKKHKQEMATTAEEAWQLSGVAVFDEECQDRVNETILDPEKVAGIKMGYLDRTGRLHGVNGLSGRCYLEGCDLDHRYDSEDFNFTIWEDPVPGWGYSIGVDIAEGGGGDYSVIFVNKIGQGGWPDEQVALYRSNQIEPIDLAFYADKIGRMYNEGLMCIEYNVYRETGNLVLTNYHYPNVYRWINPENKNPVTNKWHWLTQYSNKSNLWHTGRKWIKAGCWIIRSKNFLQEMQTFQKDDDDSKMASHEKGSHDDELMAGMIALYCAHQLKADDTGKIPIPVIQKEAEAPRYIMTCVRCQHAWGAFNPAEQYRCPNCSSINLTGMATETVDNRTKIEWPGSASMDVVASEPIPGYDQL